MRTDESLRRAEELWPTPEAGEERTVNADALCWSNRWHPTEPRCTKPGIWGRPGAGDSFGRAVRWCDDHRHADDVVIPFGWPTPEPAPLADALDAVASADSEPELERVRTQARAALDKLMEMGGPLSDDEEASDAE